MGEGRAFRYEPEGTRGLERRENRGGACARPQRKAHRLAETTAAQATVATVSAPSRIGFPRLPVLVIAPIV